MTLMQTQFLVGEDRYEFDLPPGFSLREIRTAISLGPMWRNFVYWPREEDHPAAEPGLMKIDQDQAPNGIGATIYEQRQPPAVRVLAWHLQRGVLVSAFNPTDGDALKQYFRGVAVTDGASPTLSYGGFFQAGDIREVIQRDEVTFDRGGGLSEEVINLQRLPVGGRAEGSPPVGAGFVLRTADTRVGLAVRWGGPINAAPKIELGIAALAKSIRRVG